MSDKHYTKAPQNLLDQAIEWLGQEYGLVAPAETTITKESAAEPNDTALATMAPPA